MINLRLSYLDKKAKLQVAWYNRVTAPRIRKRLPAMAAATHTDDRVTTFFADGTREMEIHDEDQTDTQLVLTCYFTQKADPQYGIVRAKADIAYIAPWYESMVKLGLKGVVVHDGLEQEFINKYQNEFVRFRRYRAGNYSIFEERWIAYFLFLQGTRLQKAFFTDANDVYITADPFLYATHPHALYVGRDNANRVRLSGWLMDELASLSADSGLAIPHTLPYQPVYNAGVVGGSRQTLLYFMTQMFRLLFYTQTKGHKDMSLVNWVIHTCFGPNLSYHANEPRLVNAGNDAIATQLYIKSGFPLNSEFKKFQQDSGAIFIHK